MAKESKKKEESAVATEDFTNDLIKAINREAQKTIAFNLSEDVSPSEVHRWTSTGSKLLDYIIANKKGGGLPEGRIIEIFGPPSIGKSHIAAQISKSTQRLGGIVIYMDTENATSAENLAALGIDLSKRFVFAQPGCIEEVFQIAENTVLKAKSMNKDVPITIIWDSVAGTPAKAELEADYEQNSMGLAARVISKSMRKFTQIVGNSKVTFVVLNQVRTKLGVMYGDPLVTPGGLAIPFHSSVRIKLGSGKHIVVKDGKDERVIGINVSAKTIKNKVSPPFRSCEFEIHFGVGIKEHQQILTMLREHGPAEIVSGRVCVEGDGAWKTFWLEEDGKRTKEIKFTKNGFEEHLYSKELSPIFDEYIEAVMTSKFKKLIDIDPESYSEVEALSH